MIVLDPRFIHTAKSWCDQVTPLLEQFGSIPRLENDNQWKDWATRIQSLPRICAMNPPNPNDFTDWKSWAIRFNQCLNG